VPEFRYARNQQRLIVCRRIFLPSAPTYGRAFANPPLPSSFALHLRSALTTSIAVRKSYGNVAPRIRGIFSGESNSKVTFIGSTLKSAKSPPAVSARSRMLVIRPGSSDRRARRRRRDPEHRANLGPRDGDHRHRCSAAVPDHLPSRAMRLAQCAREYRRPRPAARSGTNIKPHSANHGRSKEAGGSCSDAASPSRYSTLVRPNDAAAATCDVGEHAGRMNRRRSPVHLGANCARHGYRPVRRCRSRYRARCVKPCRV